MLLGRQYCFLYHVISHNHVVYHRIVLDVLQTEKHAVPSLISDYGYQFCILLSVLKLCKGSEDLCHVL